MGWSVNYYASSKESFIAEQVREQSCTRKRSDGTEEKGRWVVLEHSLHGGHLWMLVELTWESGESERFIALDLVRSWPAKAEERRNGCTRVWGSKNLDESCGPNAVDCPLKYLNMAPLGNREDRHGWRERVRTYHATKAEQAKQRRAAPVVIGQVYAPAERVKSGPLRIVRLPSPGKRSFLVEDVNSHATYRCTTRHLGKRMPELDDRMKQELA